MCNSTPIAPSEVIKFSQSQNDYVLLKVVSRSMEPTICKGNFAVLQRCKIQDIQFGEIYAVELTGTTTITTIKKLFKGTTPDNLLFVPINTAEFDSQIFPISRIMSIYKVVGTINLF